MGKGTIYHKVESGKTEAWVVLEAGSESRIYAGLKPGTTQNDLQRALASRTIENLLSSFTPTVGDAVFLRAGTVHSLGGLVVFEVQENSDVTFRLYDWDRIDPKTNKPRPLQVEQALVCIDFATGVIGPVAPVLEATTPVRRERLFHCEHFSVWRHSGQSPFTVGAADVPRVLVCIEGAAEVEHGSANFPVSRGDVVLLPGGSRARVRSGPHHAVSLLEVALPGNSSSEQDRDGQQGQLHGNSKNEKARCFRPRWNSRPE